MTDIKEEIFFNKFGASEEIKEKSKALLQSLQDEIDQLILKYKSESGIDIDFVTKDQIQERKIKIIALVNLGD